LSKCKKLSLIVLKLRIENFYIVILQSAALLICHLPFEFTYNYPFTSQILFHQIACIWETYKL
jgi:hypothetical protein